MTLALYMDHNVPRAITAGLRRRGIDVLSAYEDGAHEFEDAALCSNCGPGSLSEACRFEIDLAIESSMSKTQEISME